MSDEEFGPDFVAEDCKELRSLASRLGVSVDG